MISSFNGVGGIAIKIAKVIDFWSNSFYASTQGIYYTSSGLTPYSANQGWRRITITKLVKYTPAPDWN